MTVRLTDEARRHIALFEAETDVVPRDCVVTDGAGVAFVIDPADMARAIGPDGRRVERVEDRLGDPVELVEAASEPGTFVANALRPAAVYDVTVRERDRDGDVELVAYAEVDRADMGVAIGPDGKTVWLATRLADRHFDVDAVELVPDPASCAEAVAEETDVEPVDVVFDATHERLVVLAPSGCPSRLLERRSSHRQALRADLGWPVEVVENAPDAAGLIANALAPAQVRNVTVSDTDVAYVEVDSADTGTAIGDGGRTIDRARLLAERHAGVGAVELV